MLKLTRTSASKLSSRYDGKGHSLSESLYETKVNAAAHIDELVQISSRGRTREDEGGIHGEFASEGFNYRNAFFQDFDGRTYRLDISIAQGKDGNVVYNIGNVRERSLSAALNASPGSSVKDGAQSRKTSTDKVAETSALVKRKSRKSDAEYLAAVERGDTDAAQRMVDEAAHEAGYTVKAYHGTPNGTFNVFREWSYFTESKKYADVYQNQGASSNGYKQTASNPKTYSVYLDPKDVFDTRTERDRRIFQNEFYRQWGNGAPLSERGLPDWTDGDDLIEFFDDKGYDYDAFYLDEGGTGGYGDKVEDRGVSIIVKDSAQVKSADPVTYDDNGNVIPLSERFNSGKKDIRYSRTENQPLRDGADNDTMFSNNVTGGRGNGDHAGVFGQAQPVHSGTSSQETGGPGVSGEMRRGQAQAGRLLHSGPEALQIERKVADYRTKAFIEPAETWENGDAFAYTDKNGVIHIRDDIPASRVDEVMGHELTHVLKRKGFQPYLAFVSRVSDAVDLEGKAGNRLLEQVAEHRNIDLTKPLTAANVETISDEIAALVRGAEMSGHVEDIIGELREAFADYDAFARELNEIHEQYVRSVERSSDTRFSRMTRGTEAERRTAALERQNDVLREQVCEAIALENAGDIGVYYIKKGASVPIGVGVQFPRQRQKALASSDGIVHGLSEKVKCPTAPHGKKHSRKLIPNCITGWALLTRALLPTK